MGAWAQSSFGGTWHEFWDAAVEGARDERMEGAAEDATEGERWVGCPRETGNMLVSCLTRLQAGSRFRKQGPCSARNFL